MSALAVSAGFSNASHLSIVFRQATAQTPTAYRSQFRGRTHALVVGSDRDAIPEQSRSSPEQADL
jgi:AraC-like DNA-binding protein